MKAKIEPSELIEKFVEENDYENSLFILEIFNSETEENILCWHDLNEIKESNYYNVEKMNEEILIKYLEENLVNAEFTVNYFN